MAYLISNIPYFKVWVRKEFTCNHERYHGEFVHGLGLKNFKEWKKYYNGELSVKGIKPEDIPATPNRVYKDQGWIGYGDWLGTEKTKKKRKS